MTLRLSCQLICPKTLTHKVTEVRVLAVLSQVYSGDAADLWLRLFLWVFGNGLMSSPEVSILPVLWRLIYVGFTNEHPSTMSCSQMGSMRSIEELRGREQDSGGFFLLLLFVSPRLFARQLSLCPSESQLSHLSFTTCLLPGKVGSPFLIPELGAQKWGPPGKQAS